VANQQECIYVTPNRGGGLRRIQIHRRGVHLELFVSVSDANTGAPISHLLPNHFKLCTPTGKLFDTAIAAGTEASWGHRNDQPSGCYSLGISISKDGDKQKLEWIEGEYYSFGIQVCFTDEHNETHVGQTVVRVQSLGR
jgi:hypothetical protein